MEEPHTSAAPPGWFGYTRGLCGVAIASDVICDRPVAHGRSEDPVRHRAHDPSGSGAYVEYDDDGVVTDRVPRPLEAINTPAVAEVLGEVPSGYRPGGIVTPPPRQYVLGDGIAADDFEEAVARAEERRAAQERVCRYVLTRDAFYGREMLDDDVVDTAYPSGDTGARGAHLLFSDLRLLAGVETYVDSEGFPASRMRSIL